MTLPSSLQQSIKIGAMHDLMKRRPFPADQLLQVFLIALQYRHLIGLLWFGQAIASASADPKKSEFKRLAQEVSIFARMSLDFIKSTNPQEFKIFTLLSFAQLRVAVALDDMVLAAKLVDRALAESSLADSEHRQYFEALIASTVMQETGIPIGPRRWLSMHLDMVASTLMGPLLNKPDTTGGPIDAFLPSGTQDQIMFIIRASALRSVDDLVELIETLDRQPKDVRARYLGAAAQRKQSLHIIVAASLQGSAKQPNFDARSTAAAFRKLSQTQSASETSDLAIELLCAEADVLDEYANDMEGALEVLRLAQEAHPHDYRINRHRQKVFFRHRRYAEALAEFGKFGDLMPTDRPVDRAYAMREAGRSAAEIGDLASARNFFGEAWESARTCGEPMRAMTAGLSADCAVLDFEAGKCESALSLMLRALLEADGLDPKAGLQQAFVKRVHIGAILYMRGAAADFPAARQAMVYGMCSEPEPSEWFRDQPQAQPNFVWYQLAELEAEISTRRDVLIELRRRTKSGGLLPLETMLAASTIRAAVRELDVDRFLSEIVIWPKAEIEGIRTYTEWKGRDLFNIPQGKISPITEHEWSDTRVGECTKRAVLSFMLGIGVRRRVGLMRDLRKKIKAMPGLWDLTKELFYLAENPSNDRSNIFLIVANVVGKFLNKQVIDANDIFLSCAAAIQFLDGGVFGETIASIMMVQYEKLWQDLLENRAFSMRSPRTNGPIILEAMRKGELAIQRMANMALATEAAAKAHLSDDLRNQLSKIAAKKIRPNPPQD